ncbi:MAG: hypothetical protein IPK46_15325 [Saprospiraceae bacterium]|nr:hypothetical protein [Saprospiraceae bacterium]
MDDLKIPYEGNFVPAKSGFTELVVNGDKSALINYAYIIRDEEINALISKNKDTNARRAIIETLQRLSAS